MRVASVCAHYPSPHNPVMGIFVQRRLEALARIADVSVVSPQPWFPAVRPYRAAPAPGVPPVHRPRMFYLPGVMKRLDGRWLERAILPTLKRLDAEQSIDVIDAHFEYPEGVGAVRAARRLGLPAFVTLRGLLGKYMKLKSHRRQMIEAFRDATGLITVSRSLCKDLQDIGVSGDKIFVIPNGVDAATFRLGDSDEARRLLHVDPGAKLIVTVGHVVPGKGYSDLVDAAGRLRRRWPTLRVIAMGSTAADSSHYAKLTRKIHGLGLQGVFSFLGRVSPEVVATSLVAANLFVLPTLTEGCCNAVLEALACGAPVVTTSAGDNTVYVRDYETGLIAPACDPAGLATAIEGALAHEWDRSYISRSVSNRGWDNVAADVVAAFRLRGIAA